MVDCALGHAGHAPPAGVEAPAEIDLLHVGKEAGVEPAQCAEIGRAHQQGGARGPEDFCRSVILPSVFLYHVHHAAAAERVAVGVDPAAARPGKLEAGALLEAPHLGLAGGDLRVGVHEVEQRGEPSGGGLHVGIEQKGVFAIHFLQGAVVAFGKTVVAVEQDEPHLGEVAAQEGEGIVGGGIVGHYHFHSLHAEGMAEDAGEILPHHAASVPVEYDDGEFHQGRSVLSAAAGGKKQGGLVGIEAAEADIRYVVVQLGAVGALHAYVVFGEAVHGCARTGVLPEDACGAADVAAVEVFCLFLREVEQETAALVFHFGRHNGSDLQGLRAGTLGVGEDVELGKVGTAEEVVGLAEEAFRLAPHAYDDVDADEDVGHGGVDAVEERGKERRVVAPAHETQYLVAAALQGNVEMGHELPARGHEVYHVVAYQIGLQARHPVTLDALHAVQGAEQIDETLSRGLAEVAYVDAREHYLLAAFGRHFPGLLLQGADRGVAAPAAGQRDGAVGAEVVAAVLHLEKIARPAAAAATGRKGADVAEGGDEGAAAGLVGGMLQEAGKIAGQLPFLLGAEHEVHSLHPGDGLGLELRVAAGDHDTRTGMPPPRGMDGLAALLVGHFGDGACVDDAQVGHLAAAHLAHAGLAQEAGQSGGFRKIQLAAQRIVGGFLVLKAGSVDHRAAKIRFFAGTGTDLYLY